MSLVLYCTLDCLRNGSILINSHYVRWVNVINNNAVVLWYPKDISRQFERRGKRVFWVKWYSCKKQTSFLAHKPFLRPKEKHQQNWAIFSNLQKGSCAQKFICFFNYFSWPNGSCYLSLQALPGLLHLGTGRRYCWYQPQEEKTKYFLPWNPHSYIFTVRYGLHHNSHLIKEKELK